MIPGRESQGQSAVLVHMHYLPECLVNGRLLAECIRGNPQRNKELSRDPRSRKAPWLLIRQRHLILLT